MRRGFCTLVLHWMVKPSLADNYYGNYSPYCIMHPPIKKFWREHWWQDNWISASLCSPIHRKARKQLAVCLNSCLTLVKKVIGDYVRKVPGKVLSKKIDLEVLNASFPSELMHSIKLCPFTGKMKRWTTLWPSVSQSTASQQSQPGNTPFLLVNTLYLTWKICSWSEIFVVVMYNIQCLRPIAFEFHVVHASMFMCSYGSFIIV